MRYNPNDVSTWPIFRPLIIAHDVGRSRDRSTAVIGGNSPCGQRLIGIAEAEELPLNLVGRARASALAAVDRRYNGNALIVADLSNDESYADALLELFGPRVIGLHITRHGNGMTLERRTVGHSGMWVYTIGRTFCLNFCKLNCNPIKSSWPRHQNCGAPMNNSPIWKRSTETPAPSTPARRGCTMISEYPARCWYGQLDIRT